MNYIAQHGSDRSISSPGAAPGAWDGGVCTNDRPSERCDSPSGKWPDLNLTRGEPSKYRQADDGQAIFSILDHSLRRNADQDRVIGTLLGTRSEDGTEVEIRNSFAVGHTETTDQVEVDMEYQKQMLALHLKANPREVLVGWYATSSELNTFSALIQNFYNGHGHGDGTWPHPAVHLTVSTEPGKDIETRAYISAPVGVTSERTADSAAFIPVPHEIRYGEAERSGLEAIANARDAENRTTDIFSDIETLERAIEDVLGMIDRVSRYVEAVLDEEAQPSTALGQFLLNTLALAPKVDPSDIERDLYVSIPFLPSFRKESTNEEQQQPHPRRSCCILPGQHHPNSDGAFQQTGHSTADAGRGRIGVSSARTTGQGWAQRTTTADAGTERRGSSMIWFSVIRRGVVSYG